MGCVFCKFYPSAGNRKKPSRTISATATPLKEPNHLVELTSTTYGLLRVDSPVKAKSILDSTTTESEAASNSREKLQEKQQDSGLPGRTSWVEKKVRAEAEEPVATINAWELMAGLDDDSPHKKDYCHCSKPYSGGKENSSRSPRSENKKTDNNYSYSKSGGSRVPFSSRDINYSSAGAVPLRRRTGSGGPVFEPGLGTCLERAMERLSEDQWNAVRDSDTPTLESAVAAAAAFGGADDPLLSYEERCPPGGACAAVLYTTTLRGIRKTFEECNAVRGALEGYGVRVSERDVSMHLEFRHELRRLMGGKLVNVPRLFIRGRYIGGADEVLRLHDEGRLALLLLGLPPAQPGRPCDGCAGVRFVPCLSCNGSCKLWSSSSAEEQPVRCPDCNENGLIQCPICSIFS